MNSIRDDLNRALGVLSDSRLAGNRQFFEDVDHEALWDGVLGLFATTREERPAFFERHPYDWAFDRESYNSVFEAQLQWRLLTTLSDIPASHPDLVRAGHIVIREAPNLSTRAHVRRVDPYQVIVLPAGYLSALKGFLRVWLKGRGLARPYVLKPATTFEVAADDYLLAVDHRQEELVAAAKAYIGLLFQLNENELAVMDSESIFDPEIIDRNLFQTEFAQITSAVDGFVIFHEVAHILRGHIATGERNKADEIQADSSSVSLSLVDQARSKAGNVFLGGQAFFAIELARSLAAELLGHARKELNGERYPGIEELMERSRLHEDHVRRVFAPMDLPPMFAGFGRAMTQVFDTIRWAMLDGLPRSSLVGEPFDVSLKDFLARPARPATRSELLWTPGAQG